MITYRNFYSNFCKKNIEELSSNNKISPQDFNFVITSPLTDEIKMICPHCKLENSITSSDDNKVYLKCGHIVTENLVEIPDFDFYEKTQNSVDTSKDERNSPSKSLQHFSLLSKLDKSIHTNYVNRAKSLINQTQNRLEYNFSFLEDSSLKQNYFYQIKIDSELFQITVSQFSFSKGHINEQKLSLDLISSNISDEITKSKPLPKIILDATISEIKNLICLWTNKDIHFPNKTVSYYSLIKYPFCPEIAEIIDSNIIKKYKGHSNRNNLECYKELCKSLKIQDCKTLRKLFTKNPKTLIGYKVLLESGFKDINIISQILTSELLPLLNETYYKSYIFFIRKALHYNSEKKLFNLLLSNCNQQKYFLEDGIYIFHNYFKHINKALRKNIYKNGFNELNHDLLAEISKKTKQKNIKFKYTKDQLNLEDKINDYIFELPKNSYKLVEISIALHNCVASYSERIQNNNCTVVFATKNNKCEICIEIRGNEVYQKRGNFNCELSEDAAEVMELYQQRHNLFFTRNKY